jgi:hypothetical protein
LISGIDPGTLDGYSFSYDTNVEQVSVVRLTDVVPSGALPRPRIQEPLP